MTATSTGIVATSIVGEGLSSVRQLWCGCVHSLVDPCRQTWMPWVPCSPHWFHVLPSGPFVIALLIVKPSGRLPLAGVWLFCHLADVWLFGHTFCSGWSWGLFQSVSLFKWTVFSWLGPPSDPPTSVRPSRNPYNHPDPQQSLCVPFGQTSDTSVLDQTPVVNSCWSSATPVLNLIDCQESLQLFGFGLNNRWSLWLPCCLQQNSNGPVVHFIPPSVALLMWSLSIPFWSNHLAPHQSHWSFLSPQLIVEFPGHWSVCLIPCSSI